MPGKVSAGSANTPPITVRQGQPGEIEASDRRGRYSHGPNELATLKLIGKSRNALDWYFLSTVISAIMVRLAYRVNGCYHATWKQ